MNEYGLAFHHFGLAVSQPAAALNFLAGLGYSCGEVVRDEIQNVNLVMAKHPTAPNVEIVFPTDTPGPLDSLLKNHRELIYHLCYETENLAVTLQEMKQNGERVICVSSPKPAPLFAQRRVSFYQVKGFGLIEILEKS